jgi:hypothetical protein
MVQAVYSFKFSGFFKILTLILCITNFDLFAQGAESSSKPISIPIPVVHFGTDSDNDYTLQLLSAALQKAGNKYQRVALGHFPPRGRDFLMMEKKEGIDLMWGSARADREARFLPVRIPIFKGLIGWRIPLVMQDNQDLFQNTLDLDDLRLFRPGQHFRWTDTKILKDNGIDVFEANNHGRLMDMLISNKFDYYPRAAIEIEQEFELGRSRGVVIDRHILIIYPTAFYFYVHRDNAALAENLKSGLEELIASGEMDRLFNKHFSPILKQLEVHNRKVIRLRNNHIPKAAPFSRKALWLDPENLNFDLAYKP